MTTEHRTNKSGGAKFSMPSIFKKKNKGEAYEVPAGNFDKSNRFKNALSKLKDRGTNLLNRRKDTISNQDDAINEQQQMKHSDAGGAPQIIPSSQTDAAPQHGPTEPSQSNQTALSAHGISQIFVMLYRVMAILMIVLFVVLVLLGTVDVFKSIFGEIAQTVKKNMNAYILNKDSNDYESMKYLLNDPDKEPFTVFLRQNILAGIFKIVGILFIFVAIHALLFIGMWVITWLKGKQFNETIEFPGRIFMIIVFVFVITVVLNAMYKGTFLKSVQPTMQATQKAMNDIKSFMYNNMFNDAQFLAALQADDLERVIEQMKQYAKNGRNQLSLNKMFFTLSVYNFFKNINEADESYDEVRSMFTVEVIKKQSVDPTKYLFYKQSSYVPSLYPSLRQDFTKILGNRERSFLKEHAIVIKQFNKLLSRMQNIGVGKAKLRMYLWQTCLVALVALVVLGLMHKQELQPLFIVITHIFKKKDSNTQIQN